MKNAKTKRQEAQDLKLLVKNIAEWERIGQTFVAEGDFGSARTHGRDVADLRTVVAAVKAGEYEYARALVHNLETAAREQIPTRLYTRLFGL